MIKEAIGVAESINEATEQAKLALNAPDGADIMFDVLEQPSKKVLGIFGGSKAKVRAYFEVADEVENKPKKKKADNKSADKKTTERKPKNSNSVKAQSKTEKAENIPEYGESVPEKDIPEGTPSYKAVKYLRGILSALGCGDTEITVREREGATLICLEGEGLGVVIGRHGETLDSLQYLTSLSANIGSGYHKVTIDIGDFRLRREQTLVSLAKRIASQALRSGRTRSLEPMNPYERRIIHTAIQEIEGVSSHSVGEGMSRHIVVTVDGNDRRSHSARKNSAVSNEIKADTAREPKNDSENLPLYGKIN